MRRSSSNRSRMPSLTTSLRWMTPSTRARRRRVACSPTTSGVPPARGDAVDELAGLVRHRRRRCSRDPARGPPSRRPCGSARPSSRSTPLIRVCAVNGTNVRRAELALVPLAQPVRAPWPGRRSSGPRGSRRRARTAARRRRARPRSTPVDGHELAGLPVAERDGAGLVEQQRGDVAGGLDRAAGHREHVALHEPVHARRCRSPRAARRSWSGSGRPAGRRAR